MSRIFLISNCCIPYDKLTNMQSNVYFKYVYAKPATKKQAAQLTSSNSIVGDNFKLDIDARSKSITIANKFDFNVAQINKSFVDEIILLKNKGLIIQTILTYVSFCEPKSQHEGCFLIIAYPNQDKIAFDNFASIISNQLASGNRPDIKLDSYEYNEIIKSNGAWKPKRLITNNKLPQGTVIVKGKVSFTEKLIEAARAQKIGCYIGTVAFFALIIIIIILIIW